MFSVSSWIGGAADTPNVTVKQDVPLAPPIILWGSNAPPAPPVPAPMPLTGDNNSKSKGASIPQKLMKHTPPKFHSPPLAIHPKPFPLLFPPNPATGCAENCKLPQRGPGRQTHFDISTGLKMHLLAASFKSFASPPTFAMTQNASFLQV